MKKSGDILSFGFEPATTSSIKVIGIGGGGGNAVNHMFREGVKGVDFAVCNTDAQDLRLSPVLEKIQLGATLTEGRGAGNMPMKGEQAARESYDEINAGLEGNTWMVFLTACLGGGTGTGATPVIAQLAKEKGILTIAVVTVPSQSEGRKRYQQAMEGVNKLKRIVDSLLVIDNQKLHDIYGDLPASEAFAKADGILKTAVKGIAEIITLNGIINIDFADVRSVMADSGTFLMGAGKAAGEDRALKAVNEAISSPLLDNFDIRGAKDILLNITSGDPEITMSEIGQIIDTLQEKAGRKADIIWGNGTDKSLENAVAVTIIITGFDTHDQIKLTGMDQESLQQKKELAHKGNDKEESNSVVTEELDKQDEKVSSESKSDALIDNWFFRQFNSSFEGTES
ncbi:cell division protein FtsZ [Puteibacter caeruleilacunae]|nr:cell division protein FtsZ [Puteibacter caeruleilacunae]